MNNAFENKKKFLNNLAKLRPVNAALAKKTTICKNCKNEIERIQIVENSYICPICNYYMAMSSKRRLSSVFDDAKYKQLFTTISTTDPLNFPGYSEKTKDTAEKTRLNEAVLCAVGNISGIKTVVACMDTRYFMGSLASATGEKITQMFEYATRHKLPVVIFTASGGARMQEGIYSLFQMAKTSFALKAHSSKGLLYVTVLTNPTTGGVTASFASLGDIIIAEPKALVAFAGPRVIEQTIKQKLPDGFQSAEYVLDCGFIDMIVNRKDIPEMLSKILKIHNKNYVIRSHD